MARREYGGSLTDFTTDKAGLVRAGKDAYFWSARTGGAQVLDVLAHPDGDPAATVIGGTYISGPTGAIAILGPDGYDADGVWVSPDPSPTAPRYLLRALVINGTGSGGGGAPGVVSDATPYAKGVVRLAGDLGGTADAPVVTKTYAKADLGLGLVDNVPATALRDRATHAGTQPATSITGLAAVATSGAYNDLAGRPDLSDYLTTGAAASTYTPLSEVAERAQDAAAAMFRAGTNVSFTYDDAANTFTINASGGGAGGTDPEIVRDTIGGALVGGANIAITVNDAADSITIAVTGLASVATSGSYADLTGKPAIPTVGAAGAGAGVALSSTDPSVTSARTPTAHASTHGSGGSDPLSPAAIGAENAGAAAAAQTYSVQRANHTGTQPAATVTGLAAVATSGSYNDLSDKPSIPADYTDEQAQDAAAAMLTAGSHTGVTVTYDDAANKVNLTVTGGSASRPTATYDVRDYVQNGETLALDGSASTSAIIQRAIDAAYASRATTGPCQVYLPGGRYRLDAQLVAKDQVGLRGEGMDRTVLLPYGNQCAVRAIATPSAPLTDNHFSDFSIDGANQTNASYQTGIKGFFIQHMLRPRWHRVAVRNTWGSGFGVDFLRDYLFLGCVATGCGRGIAATGANPMTALGGSGFGIGTGAAQVEAGVIADCIATGNGVHGIFFEQQTAATTIDGPFQSRGARVQGCYSALNLIGYRDSGTDGTQVSDCTFESNTYCGVALDRTTLSPTSAVNGLIAESLIARNGAGQTSGGGIVIGRLGSSYTIRGAHIVDNTGFGVRGLVAAGTTDIGAGLVIDGARVRGNTRSGIYFGQATGLVLTGLSILRSLIRNNGSDAASAQRDGITIDTDTSGLRIIDTIAGDDQATKTQQNGIALTGARTATDPLVWRNDLRGNAAGSYASAHTTAGTATVEGNLGFQSLRLFLRDEGNALARRTALDFVGDGVTVTDDATGDRTVVTIPGATGGGGGAAAGPGTVLAYRQYAERSGSNGTTVLPNATTLTDVDGVTITATVPSTGRLKFRFTGNLALSASSTTVGASLAVFDTTSNSLVGVDQTVTTTTAKLSLISEWVKVGLSPGATVTAKLQYKVANPTSATLSMVGGLLEVVSY